MDSGQSFGIPWIPQTGNSSCDRQSSNMHLLDRPNPHEHEAGFIIQPDNIGGRERHDFLDDITTEEDIDQIAAENLIFMARDGQVVSEMIEECNEDIIHTSNHNAVHNDHSGIEQFDANYCEAQMVTEEVITDDWVQHQGEERYIKLIFLLKMLTNFYFYSRVEISVDQICGVNSNLILDADVPLPTAQDEYTALRPYPCDFCSRRFRKRTSLKSHIVAHQNDRPHVCKLCSSRFFRRSDLINHLKAHAESSEYDGREDGCKMLFYQIYIYNS